MNLLDAKIICPACSCKFSLSEGTQEAAIFEIAALAAKFGPDWPLVVSYLDCFRTATGKGLRPARMVVILTGLAEIWTARKFTYKGKSQVVNPHVLRAAIREVGQRSDDKLGFKNHNYLKQVLTSMMQQWNRQQAEQEKQSILSDQRGGGRLEPQPEILNSDPGPGRRAVKELADRTSGALDAGRALGKEGPIK